MSKIVVVNFSGNMGKTTMCVSLLKPRMPDAVIFSVESLNIDASADGVDVERIKAKRMGDLLDALMQIDNAIVDVGASNAEEFVKQLQQFAGSHEEIDLFLIPTVKEKKQQADTVNTIRTLAKIGVPKNKIFLVFNKVEIEDSVQDDFAALFGLAKLENTFLIDEGAVVYWNEIYDRLKAVGKSIGDITNDDTNYRQLLREAATDVDKEHCLKMIALKRLSVTANSNLDDVYKIITRKRK